MYKVKSVISLKHSYITNDVTKNRDLKKNKFNIKCFKTLHELTYIQ